MSLEEVSKELGNKILEDLPLLYKIDEGEGPRGYTPVSYLTEEENPAVIFPRVEELVEEGILEKKFMKKHSEENRIEANYRIKNDDYMEIIERYITQLDGYENMESFLEEIED